MANLHDAVFADDIAGVTKLLDQGAAVNEARDTRYNDACATALHVASESGNIDVVRFLLKNGADAALPNLWGLTALHLAAQENDATILEELVKAAPLAMNTMDDVDRTPLYMAAQHGALECVEVLLAAGSHADPRLSQAALGEEATPLSSPLHAAAANGQTACLKALLATPGSDLVDILDDFHRTPLQVAASSGHAECMQVLIDAGANVNTKNIWGATPLHAAVRHGHRNVVNTLLQHDAAVDATDSSNFTALHYAAQRGYEGILADLLDAGAQLDVQNKLHKTPLALAMQEGEHQIVQVLLTAGASLAQVQRIYKHCSAGVQQLLQNFVRRMSIQVAGSLKAYAAQRSAVDLGVDVCEVIIAQVFNAEEEFIRLLLNTDAEGQTVM